MAERGEESFHQTRSHTGDRPPVSGRRPGRLADSPLERATLTLGIGVDCNTSADLGTSPCRSRTTVDASGMPWYIPTPGLYRPGESRRGGFGRFVHYVSAPWPVYWGLVCDPSQPQDAHQIEERWRLRILGRRGRCGFRCTGGSDQ